MSEVWLAEFGSTVDKPFQWKIYYKRRNMFHRWMVYQRNYMNRSGKDTKNWVSTKHLTFRKEAMIYSKDYVFVECAFR